MRRVLFTLAAAAAHLLGAGTASAQGVDDEQYLALWNAPVGEPLAPIAAPDATGAARTTADLVGPEGLLLVISRSADW